MRDYDLGPSRRTSLGLTHYESLILDALLERGKLTASKAAEIAGVPRGRVYELLQSLTDKGFVAVILGEDIKQFEALDPEPAANAILSRGKEQHAALAASALKESERLREKFKAGRQGARESTMRVVQALSSKESTNAAHLESFKLARKSMDSLCKPPYLNPLPLSSKTTSGHVTLIRGAIERRVRIRAVYEEEPDHLDQFKARLKAFAELGEELRVSRSLPTKMQITDNRRVVVALLTGVNNRSGMTTLLIEHKDLSRVFSEMFQLEWGKAIPFSEYLSAGSLRP